MNKGDFQSLKKKAKNGDTFAQFVLGKCYETGNSVPKNTKEAIKWYCLAAENGYADAQFILGMYHTEKEGDAVYLITQAADSGHAEAQYVLGNCYYLGTCTTPENKTVAVKWYRMGAEQGVAKAQYKLGYCYSLGHGVQKNEETAFILFHKSAKQGFVESQFELGKCYMEGIGVLEDKKEALKWFRKAAKQGHSQAKMILKKEAKLALIRKWLETARRYSEGDGVSKDIREAIKYYCKAANQGNIKAGFELEKIAEEGHEEILDAIKKYANKKTLRRIFDSNSSTHKE